MGRGKRVPQIRHAGRLLRQWRQRYVPEASVLDGRTSERLRIHGRCRADGMVRPARNGRTTTTQTPSTPDAAVQPPLLSQNSVVSDDTGPSDTAVEPEPPTSAATALASDPEANHAGGAAVTAVTEAGETAAAGATDGVEAYVAAPDPATDAPMRTYYTVIEVEGGHYQYTEVQARSPDHAREVIRQTLGDPKVIDEPRIRD